MADNASLSLMEMTVSNADGKIDGPGIKGTLVPAGDAYHFYVPNPNKKAGSTDKHLIIRIVMPLGGTESGAYRFPRVGEQVLVGVQTTGNSSAYYLMGYLPNTSQPFTIDSKSADSTVSEVIDKQGQVLRYKKTGTNTTANKDNVYPYSEIGFYNEKTKWNDGEGKNEAIDRINIQSTGDMYVKSQNYHGTRAKRMEINVGDSKELPQKAKTGALSINAEYDIFINSATAITLKVGRSSISISDTGITLHSAVVSNGYFSSPADALLDLNPIDGLSLHAPHIEMRSQRDFSLKDNLGGGIASQLGMTKISGYDIKMGAMDNATYSKNIFYQWFDFWICMVGTGVIDVGQQVFTTWIGKLKLPSWMTKEENRIYTLDTTITGLFRKWKDWQTETDGWKALLIAVDIVCAIAEKVVKAVMLNVDTFVSTHREITREVTLDGLLMLLSITETTVVLRAAGYIRGGVTVRAVANALGVPNVANAEVTNSSIELFGSAVQLSAGTLRETVAASTVAKSELAGLDIDEKSLITKLAGKPGYALIDSILKLSTVVEKMGTVFYAPTELDKL